MSITELEYKLVSLGVIDGESKQKIIANLAGLYQTSTDEVQHFLIPDTLLQTFDNQALAEKYQQAYRIAGLQCKIELPEGDIPLSFTLPPTDIKNQQQKDKTNINNVIEHTEYAGFTVRCIAFFIDLFFVFMVGLSIVFAYDMLFGTEFTSVLYKLIFEKEFDDFLNGFYASYTEFILHISQGIIYFLIILAFWKYYGATPGKMLFSIRIVDVKTGEPATMRCLILRYFAYGISTIPFFLGFISIAFNERKQGWHDKLADTAVIKW